MIQDKPNLNVSYYSKHLESDFSLSLWEKKIIERYFREEIGILPEQKIEFNSPEVLFIIDIIRFCNNLS
jgi:hypothetical protein